jgi:hypothetical protein
VQAQEHLHGFGILETGRRIPTMSRRQGTNWANRLRQLRATGSIVLHIEPFGSDLNLIPAIP